ncbi:hypothetical protein AXK56_20075 [Tsukamurella pulmonis]|uniref:Uncharacterized protein n=1 Tax=Tsukamurella pulmonis TaxID=47312 RepID=A0A1H1HAI2_9ACTN|nr:hypothetical protein [Tsukamurella pulmonis]KXO94896.1 hypothetical protein AXK56_20075 [Tsukamurella pulmonis]SDR22467.1 hypothetical protein SAMN04489765_3977 [Tsukamurella pulmonis]SUP15408.1 Uncharacterised protein [Tsukamurella pulmonis]
MPHPLTPPFTSAGDAARFAQVLSLYLYELDPTPAVDSAARFLLLGVIDQHKPESQHWYERSAVASVRCAQCADPYPCPTVLRVALLARFPMGWRPEELAAEMRRASVGLNPEYSEVEAGRILIDLSDGIEEWRRDQGGQWTFKYVGKAGQWTRIEGDDARMIEVLLDTITSRTGPFGRRVDESDLTLARAGLPHGQGWWAAHSALPYIADKSNPIVR